MKILFILNPKSGRSKKTNRETAIRNYCKDRQHYIEFHELTGNDDSNSILSLVKKLMVTKVVAVGGDGTVNLIAKALAGTNIIMGIIPAGSANGTAKELYIPEGTEDALDIIFSGKVKSCDLIKINEKDICVHLSDFGLNARLIKYFEESPLRGMWGYARMVLKVLLHKNLMTAHVETADYNVVTKAYMVVIANAGKYGTGAVINPDGNIGDGLFEIVILRRLSLSHLFKMFRSQKYIDPNKVEILKTKAVKITTRKKTHFQIDGEYKGKIQEVKAEILPAQLKIIVSSKNND